MKSLMFFSGFDNVERFFKIRFGFWSGKFGYNPLLFYQKHQYQVEEKFQIRHCWEEEENGLLSSFCVRFCSFISLISHMGLLYLTAIFVHSSIFGRWWSQLICFSFVSLIISFWEFKRRSLIFYLIFPGKLQEKKDWFWWWKFCGWRRRYDSIC